MLSRLNPTDLDYNRWEENEEPRTTRMQELLQEVKVLTRSSGGAIRAQLVSRVPRQLSDPLVLAECRHAHRKESAAIECGRRLYRDARRRHNVDAYEPGDTA